MSARRKRKPLTAPGHVSEPKGATHEQLRHAKLATPPLFAMERAKELANILSHATREQIYFAGWSFADELRCEMLRLFAALDRIGRPPEVDDEYLDHLTDKTIRRVFRR